MKITPFLQLLLCLTLLIVAYVDADKGDKKNKQKHKLKPTKPPRANNDVETPSEPINEISRNDQMETESKKPSKTEMRCKNDALEMHIDKTMSHATDVLQTGRALLMRFGDEIESIPADIPLLPKVPPP